MEKSENKPEIKSLKNTITNLNREISRLSQNNEILAAEKKILDEILDNLPGTFYIWDERPQLIRWNRKHEEITEYSGDEYPDMRPTDFFGKQEHQFIEAAIKRTFTEGEVTVEATLVTKSGKKVPHVYSAVRTMIDQKPVLMGFGIDIRYRRDVHKKPNNFLNSIRLHQFNILKVFNFKAQIS